MTKSSQENNSASWNYAEIWDKFPVPARPSKEELAYLEKEWRARKPRTLLILGSTIEYRSLAKKLGIVPTVMDFKKEHYDTLTHYASESFSNEQFIEADWLSLADEKKYDVIVGHRAINVIAHTELETFFQKMHRALKPGGVFYCKGNIRKRSEPDRLDVLIETWAKKPDRAYPLFSYIEVALYFRCADEHGYVEYPKARALVDAWREEQKITQEDYELIRLLVSMSSDARFRGTIYDDDVRAAITRAGFAKSEWIVKDKDICSHMPIIVLTK